EIGLFHLAAAPVVDQQPLGDGMQVGPGLADGGHVLILAQQPDESVLRQVGSVLAATQLAPQPAIQPALMLDIEPLYVLLPDKTVGCHGLLPADKRKE